MRTAEDILAEIAQADREYRAAQNNHIDAPNTRREKEETARQKLNRLRTELRELDNPTPENQ